MGNCLAEQLGIRASYDLDLIDGCPGLQIGRRCFPSNL